MDWRSQKNSPLLRGGRALQQTVRQMLAEPTSPVSRQLFSTNVFPIERPIQPTKHNPPQVVMDAKGDDIVKEGLRNVHSELEEHEKRLAMTARDVEAVRSSSTCLVSRVHQLEERLASQHRSVEEVLQQTHRALEQQRLLLNTQHALIQKIYSEHASSRPWLSDAAHIGLVLYVLNTPSIRYALWLLVHKLTRRQRHQKLVLWIVRILMFAQLLKVTRAVDQWLGVTRRLSNLSSESFNIITSIRDRVYKIGSSPMPSFSSGAAAK